ncbi:hypothetical protein PF005_g28092 [Phytophthora fragariae]|uniref:Uncharacterized protein n=1 Tax=Phytophthora fragariae TaxID=53985 RepID=A0A6A3VPD5_9STRA|nr:hypothetical protein PF003_g40509 [Phytophthora fragariae]KAE8929397.1 hypothetical protein PF009_g20484 [Phytophthora fragariae]KAE9069946.1 hypothetical protein PF007_g27123 [Phytophthora fragariae]KAE9115592.1 hypothetical protein PF006_g19250 [Phytophthora fragariae]KAE9169125.1 hypothetical protein PF005_g28092 [Phytophthora fragariae]
MRLPYENNAVEQRLPYDNYAVKQGLPHVKNAVEQRLPPVQNAVERRFPHVKNAVEQRLPLENAMVEQRLPFADDSVAQQDLRDTGMVETEFPCLEEGEVSSSESSSSETSSRAVARGDLGSPSATDPVPQSIRLRRARSSTSSSIRRALRTRFARSRWRILHPTRRPSPGFQASPGSISCAT